jgi:hypothetical protein
MHQIQTRRRRLRARAADGTHFATFVSCACLTILSTAATCASLITCGAGLISSQPVWWQASHGVHTTEVTKEIHKLAAARRRRAAYDDRQRALWWCALLASRTGTGASSRRFPLDERFAGDTGDVVAGAAAGSERSNPCRRHASDVRAQCWRWRRQPAGVQKCTQTMIDDRPHSRR